MDMPLGLAIQFALSFSALGIGALKDLVDNEVPNLLWLAYGAVAVVVAFYEYGLTALLGVHLLFSGLIAVGAYVAWRFAKGYLGGADSKAIMALGLSLPIFSFLVIGYAGVGALGYLFARTIKEKISFVDAVKMKAPFLPFLFVGVVAVAVIMWLA